LYPPAPRERPAEFPYLSLPSDTGYFKTRHEALAFRSDAIYKGGASSPSGKAASDADVLCSVLRASGGERVNSSKLEFAGCLLRESGGRSEAVAAEEW